MAADPRGVLAAGDAERSEDEEFVVEMRVRAFIYVDLMSSRRRERSGCGAGNGHCRIPNEGN